MHHNWDKLVPRSNFCDWVRKPLKNGARGTVPAGALSERSLARKTEEISKSDIFPKQVKYPNRGRAESTAKGSPWQLKLHWQLLVCDIPGWQVTRDSLWAEWEMLWLLMPPFLEASLCDSNNVVLFLSWFQISPVICKLRLFEREIHSGHSFVCFS